MRRTTPSSRATSLAVNEAEGGRSPRSPLRLAPRARRIDSRAPLRAPARGQRCE
ncbi:hypothetical protein ACFPRL_14330 [Pseudoclavibacter helvolus]